MAKYDIENFFNDLETYLKSSLNSKITEINTEKNDGITLNPVANDAYFFLNLDESVANYDPFIFYTIAGVESDGIGPHTGKSYLIDVALIMSNPGNDADARSRTLRYHRALEELIESAFSKITDSINLKVNSLEPVTFASQEDSRLFRAVGVQLSFSLS